MTITPIAFHEGIRAEPDLSRIAGRLSDIADSRFDVVAPQAALSCKGIVGQFILDLGEPQLTDTGVTEMRIESRYTRTAWRQVADRLRIPLQYLDRIAEMEHEVGPILACRTINDLASIDERTALYRFVRTTEGYWLRAVLSDRFRCIDNDLALRAIIGGLDENGLALGDCEITGDVTQDRLRLRIAVPQVAVAVPDLLAGYLMPYSLRPGRPVHAVAEAGETPPILWAGIEIANSETGHGAFSIAPRAVIQVCRNGLTRAVDFRRAHIGAALEEGTIDWSAETQQRALDLITSQVRDAVATYISPGYLSDIVNEMADAKQVPVQSAPVAVAVVQDRFGLTGPERDAVFELFAAGGDRSVFGLGNAVTAAAQLAEDGDRQSELECRFWEIVGQPDAFVGAT